MPKDSKYEGFVFYHPNKLIKDTTRIVDFRCDEREQCKEILFKNDFTFKLFDRPKEVELNTNQFLEAFSPKQKFKSKGIGFGE